MRPSPGPHLDTLTLHQLRYGELDEAEEQAARAHLDACPACRQRHEGQQAFRRAFEAAPPPITLPQAAPAPAGPSLWEQLLGWLRWAPVPALALAAALLFVGLPDRRADTERTKGADEVVVVVEGHGVLDEGEQLRPGDRLQLRVPAGPWEEAWVGDGEELIGSFDLSAERATLSPFALDVDAEPGDEVLVVVLSAEPLGEEAARAAMQGRRMGGVEVRRFLLPKGR